MLGRYSFRGRGATNFIIFLAIAVPEIVLGSSLLSMFVQVNNNKPAGISVDLGYPTILFSHIAFSIAFVAITVRARVQGLDLTLENAAQDLFASPRVAFFKVTFPLILPGIVAGFLLAFVLSLDDFVITNFVNGTDQHVPDVGVRRLAPRDPAPGQRLGNGAVHDRIGDRGSAGAEGAAIRRGPVRRR